MRQEPRPYRLLNVGVRVCLPLQRTNTELSPSRLPFVSKMSYFTVVLLYNLRIYEARYITVTPLQHRHLSMESINLNLLFEEMLALESADTAYFQ